jgi:hypothetical protein
MATATNGAGAYLSRRAAENLMDALSFAETIGFPLNVSVDINWVMFGGTTHDRIRLARLQERVSKWCVRRDFPLTMIWVREVGGYGAPHVHILLHVLPWLAANGEFELALNRAVEPEGGPNHDQAIRVRPAYDPEGKLRYMLKGLRRKDAALLGVRRTSYQGEITGKRAGTTENIGRRARDRYWIREGRSTPDVGAPYNLLQNRGNGLAEPTPSRLAASKFEVRTNRHAINDGGAS